MNDKESILIVDDDESICKTLSLIFSKKGYETETAGTGREGIEKAQERFFNLALIDIKLPDIEGVDLLRPLNKMHPAMAVLMVTAYASVESAIQALKDGASAYITKPLNMDEVLSTVSGILEKQRLLRDKRHAEELLQQSEERFRQFFENVPEYCYMISQQGIILDINRGALKTLGYKKGELVGNHLKMIYAPESLPKMNPLFPKWKKTGKLKDEEMVIITKQGNRRTVLLSADAVPDKDVRIRHFVFVQRDITERKLAEKKLEHLNLVLRAIRKVNQLIVMEKDRDRLIQSACENFVETRGYFNAWIVLLDKHGRLVTTAEAGLGKDFLPMVKRLRRGKLTDCGQKALRQPEAVVIKDSHSTCTDCPLSDQYSGRGGMTMQIEHEGKIYGLLSASIPIDFFCDEEEQSLFQEVSADIALALHSIEQEKQRKQAEEALRESEQIYRTLVESSTDAILMMDKERTVVTCNQAFSNLFGYEKGEIEGKSIRLIHKSDESFHSFRDTAYPVIDKDGFIRVELDFMRKDGTIFQVETVTSAIKSPDGPIRGYVAIIRDVTDRKKLETQLQQAQKMEAIGTLAGGVAHDFNNLLTTIIGNADLMSMNLSKDDPLCESIALIKKAGQSAATLTRQLLAFSRKQVIQPKILDLNEVIRGIEKMLGRLIREDVEMKTSLEPTLWPVKIDPGQTEQVMVNLVVNARDAMPHGGKLTIKTANVDLDENFFHSEGIKPACGTYAMIAVSDTGIGMDEETQLRIFEPFFTTKERDKGTGLGLATVYGIVKQNAGYIFAHSEPGQGVTFKVYLPRVEGEVTSFEKEQGPMNGFRGSETILLVEDDDTLRDLAKKILQKHGYSVLDAHNGEKALRVTDKHHGPLHLILTDVVMPGMNGREVVERLQSLRQEIKVLYMSGYLDNEIAPHGILDPGINFIEKPFTPSGLAMKVRRVLDQEIEY